MECSLAFVQTFHGAIFQRKARNSAFLSTVINNKRLFPIEKRFYLRRTMKYAKVTMETPVNDGTQVDQTATNQMFKDVPSIALQRYVTGFTYAAFVVYALFFAPGSISESVEYGKLFSGNFNDTNDIFFAIFNLVGATCINFAVLLNAGASRQTRLPTRWFSLLGVFVGFFALGPYLTARDYAPSATVEDVEKAGFISRILESRLFSIGNFLYTLWIYAFAFGLFSPGSEQLHDVMFYSSLVELGRMFTSDRAVCITIIDTVVLSIGTLGALTEDMKRRGWFEKGREGESLLTALSIILAPGLGPALYLALRPRLPHKNKYNT